MRRVAVAVAAVFLLAACSEGNVFSLEVGTCFNDADSTATELSEVPIVDCSEPHDNEVYHLFDLPDGDYPGEAAVSTAANEGCLDAFAGYVGTAYLDSELDYFPLTPTSGSWDAGDREVVCALYDLTLAQLTGSMQGAGR